MVMGIFSKILQIGDASIHDVLDRTRNSKALAVPIAKRDLAKLVEYRKSTDKGVGAAITETRSLQALQRKHAARIAELEETINFVLTDDDPTNDAAAKPKIVEQERWQAELVAIASRLELQQQTKAGLEQALVVIDGRIDELDARIKAVESNDVQAHAKEEAAAALDAAKSILDSTAEGGKGMDSTLQAAEKRNTQADVHLERQLELLNKSTGKTEKDIELDAKLAARKRKLQAQKAPA